MRKFLVITASVASLLAACDSEVSARSTRTVDDGVQARGDAVQTGRSEMRVGSRLDCPEREGDLRLASAAPDGRSCAYRSRDGDAEVQLQLTALIGPADARLQALEADLRGLIPTAAAAAAAPPLPPLRPAPPSPPGEEGERTRVEMPGVRIETQGERAVVRLPGVEINAEGENADVRVNGENGETVVVRAKDDAAEIRTRDSGAQGDIRSTYLLASETAGPSGWRVAGYRAAGPGEGPLVIATVRARGRNNGDDLMGDLEELVDRNVGR